MRRALTEPEMKLRLQLRAKRFAGAKFRRQVVIGPYIADFACRSPMLIVEIDGDTHAERETQDALRAKMLEARGYHVLRFWNSDVMTNLDGVLHAIAEALRESPSP
jgi:very-short-patch-repair endonuclease